MFSSQKTCEDGEDGEDVRREDGFDSWEAAVAVAGRTVELPSLTRAMPPQGRWSSLCGREKEMSHSRTNMLIYVSRKRKRRGGWVWTVENWQEKDNWNKNKDENSFEDVLKN